MSNIPTALPPIPSLRAIRRRLPAIFSAGTPNRANATGDRAARTAFVFLYIGAIEGGEKWVRPDQVTRMTDAQSKMTDDRERQAWAAASLRGRDEVAGRWYRANSREGIRDDTLRYAWQPAGAVVERSGLATTSSRPRWALERGFAGLLTHGVSAGASEAALERAESSREYIEMLAEWQELHLSAEGMARVQLLRQLTAPSDAISVTLPNGNVRHMAAGESSQISKAVIEEFAKRFLGKPALVWLSESGNQQPLADAAMARKLKLDIENSGILPDIILVDLEPKKPLLVFCEVVASDGPMSEVRRKAVLELVRKSGYSTSHVALMTAFLDRDSNEFRKSISLLASGTFAWCASEPNRVLMDLSAPVPRLKLAELVKLVNGGG